MKEEMENKKALLITDVFWMALIKAFCNRMPDQYNIIEVQRSKKKIQAVYQDGDRLPAFSEIKIVMGDKQISINDFRFAYFEIKDKLFEILKEQTNC